MKRRSIRKLENKKKKQILSPFEKDYREARQKVEANFYGKLRDLYEAKVITLEAYGLLSRIETAVDNHERASLIKQFEEEESSNIILDTLEKMRRLRFSDGVQAMLLILSDLIEEKEGFKHVNDKLQSDQEFAERLLHNLNSLHHWNKRDAFIAALADHVYSLLISKKAILDEIELERHLEWACKTISTESSKYNEKLLLNFLKCLDNEEYMNIYMNNCGIRDSIDFLNNCTKVESEIINVHVIQKILTKHSGSFNYAYRSKLLKLLVAIAPHADHGYARVLVNIFHLLFQNIDKEDRTALKNLAVIYGLPMQIFTYLNRQHFARENKFYALLRLLHYEESGSCHQDDVADSQLSSSSQGSNKGEQQESLEFGEEQASKVRNENLKLLLDFAKKHEAEVRDKQASDTWTAHLSIAHNKPSFSSETPDADLLGILMLAQSLKKKNKLKVFTQNVDSYTTEEKNLIRLVPLARRFPIICFTEIMFAEKQHAHYVDQIKTSLPHFRVKLDCSPIPATTDPEKQGTAKRGPKGKGGVMVLIHESLSPIFFQLAKPHNREVMQAITFEIQPRENYRIAGAFVYNRPHQDGNHLLDFTREFTTYADDHNYDSLIFFGDLNFHSTQKINIDKNDRFSAENPVLAIIRCQNKRWGKSQQWQKLPNKKGRTLDVFMSDLNIEFYESIISMDVNHTEFRQKLHHVAAVGEITINITCDDETR